MLYAALAGVSLAFALSLAVASQTSVLKNIRLFELAQLADTLGNAMLVSNSFSATVYLPPGLCGAIVSNNTITTSYGNAYLPFDIVAENDVFCPDGTYARVSAYESGALFYLSRG